MEQGEPNPFPMRFTAFWIGKPYYLPRTYLPIARGIEIIRRCGGAAVLAHPLQYGYSPAELRRLVAEAAAFGSWHGNLLYRL